MTSKINIKDKSETDELIKVAPFRREIRKTEPHKHNSYFEIIYLSKGKGTHTIDHNQYVIKPPVVFFVRKEQVHHWHITSVPQGYVLILKKAFVEKSLDSELKVLFSKASGLTCLQIDETTTIELIFDILTRENNFSIIEGLLKALLAKTLETAKPLVIKAKIANNLFESFRDLLNQTDAIKNSVAHYAKLLNTTPQNLNFVCRKAVNQSAAEVLIEHIIGEAKRLLHYTSDTVSEISFMLDFNDASHFVKYFKRHTGQTPQAFRSS